MNVTITENPALDDIEVSVACPRIDERVQRIVSALGAFDRALVGERDGATYRLDVDDVCYAETVDGKTFLYTADAVYQTPLKLYELEERLDSRRFARISNSEIINLGEVRSFDLSIAGTICVQMKNGEVAYVSRRYVSKIKKILGL